MKKITLSLLGCFAFMNVNAQIFSENFNASTSLPTGWTTNATTGSEVWEVGNTAFYEEFTDNVAFFDDDYAGEDVINVSSLVSPVINLSAVTNPVLNFSFVNETYLSPTTFKVEGFNGTSWVTLYTLTGEEIDWDANYIVIMTDVNNISLSQFTNADFKLRFTYDDLGDWSFGCAVDNVSITAGALATSEVGKAEVWRVYPVPVKDVLNIKKPQNVKNYSLSITDVTGKSIKHFNDAQDSYNLSDLVPGQYFITIKNGENTIQKKIIKK